MIIFVFLDEIEWIGFLIIVGAQCNCRLETILDNLNGQDRYDFDLKDSEFKVIQQFEFFLHNMEFPFEDI